MELLFDENEINANETKKFMSKGGNSMKVGKKKTDGGLLRTALLS